MHPALSGILNKAIGAIVLFAIFGALYLLFAGLQKLLTRFISDRAALILVLIVALVVVWFVLIGLAELGFQKPGA